MKLTDARAAVERLAVDYPAVTVHRRELSGEPLEVWYVYRDGHWLSGRWR